jgi:hypothetical protein
MNGWNPNIDNPAPGWYEAAEKKLDEMFPPLCQHRLGDRTGLLCVLPAGHDFGHTYQASWAPDAVRDEEVDE